MKKYFIKIYILLTVSVFGLFLLPTPSEAGRLSEYTIICGNTKRCDMATHSCIQCFYSEFHLGSAIVTLGFGNTSTDWHEYHCVSKGVTSANAISTYPGNSPDSCADTGGRGGEGVEITENYVFGIVEDQTQQAYNCITSNLRAMYGSVCYTCIIIETLVSAFTTAGAAAYDVSRALANAILTVATVLWLGIYVLKSISSFATVEPMKMLNDIFIQLFKVLVAYVVVNSGISTIVHYTIEPLMNTGLDFASAILRTLGGYI